VLTEDILAQYKIKGREEDWNKALSATGRVPNIISVKRSGFSSSQSDFLLASSICKSLALGAMIIKFRKNTLFCYIMAISISMFCIDDYCEQNYTLIV